jgi:hypothetical protein
VNGNKKKEIGALPAQSVALLAVIGTVWVAMGGYFVSLHVKK